MAVHVAAAGVRLIPMSPGATCESIESQMEAITAGFDPCAPPTPPCVAAARLSLLLQEAIP